MRDLDQFTKGYMECALWCGVIPDAPEWDEYEYDYEPEDLTPETLAAMIEDCADFQHNCRQLLVDYYNSGRGPDDAGHDFWLTRNGHGAGFWDRGLGQLGDKLADACKPYGETSLFAVDGKVIQE